MPGFYGISYYGSPLEHVINQLNANWFLIPSLYVMKYVTTGKTSCGY